MNFLSILLQGISFVPAIVSGIKNIFGGRPGAEKKNAALSFLEAALSMGDAVASRQIVDEVKFRAGLEEVISGVVECLNASAWARLQVKLRRRRGRTQQQSNQLLRPSFPESS